MKNMETQVKKKVENGTWVDIGIICRGLNHQDLVLRKLRLCEGHEGTDIQAATASLRSSDVRQNGVPGGGLIRVLHAPRGSSASKKMSQGLVLACSFGQNIHDCALLQMDLVSCGPTLFKRYTLDPTSKTEPNSSSMCSSVTIPSPSSFLSLIALM